MMPDPIHLLRRLFGRTDPPAGPLCDGCDDAGQRLVRFTNGRDYCERCGQEIRDLGWAKPVSR